MMQCLSTSYGLFFVTCFTWRSLIIEAFAPITFPIEVDALRTIRKSLVDPYKNLGNWDEGDPCASQWKGITCYSRSSADGYLHIQQLDLLNLSFSGILSPDLGLLTRLTIVDFMWNDISGSIPKEIANIKTLVHLLLNGNKLTGILPEELGFLPKLRRLQIDQNFITGPIPKSFAYLQETRHFHMNNNSISGQIPHELSRLPNLVHLLLDSNNLSGFLPPEIANIKTLKIIQLDNNHFDDGTEVPAAYGGMRRLLKMSFRNCNLVGPVPDLSGIPKLGYLDLSANNLSGTIPQKRLSENITTIDLSSNNINGSIPSSFSGLPHLQRLALQYNKLTNISGQLSIPADASLRLDGNPLCSNSKFIQLCGSTIQERNGKSSNVSCSVCPPPYEVNPKFPEKCLCSAPLLVDFRLKSPGIWDFRPYIGLFEEYLTSSLSLSISQLVIDSFTWEEGPRLRMSLKFFPEVTRNGSYIFNRSELHRITNMFMTWSIPDNDIFGPYELLHFNLSSVYAEEAASSRSSALSKSAIIGIVVGTIAAAATLSAIVSLFILRARISNFDIVSRRRHSSKVSKRIEGVKYFTFKEMAMATNNFSTSTLIGQGGYGMVYKGILADHMVVAIKRAKEGSIQGEKEFLTEIELLSRLHHRNLVSLIGYCDEECEQMLVYEYMPNGTLRDCLSAACKEPLTFSMRLSIALGSAKGILYLHTEADPPIFHRDIKASNILLDSKYNAKVADFGLSRLAPVPDVDGNVPTYVSTVVKGTPGYLDPQYFLTHQLTDKSDVYSLGVVFLELLTGLQPISQGKNIVKEVGLAFRSRTVLSLIDQNMGPYPSESVMKLLDLALDCCQDENDMRPSMAVVVRELEMINETVPEYDINTKDIEAKAKHAASSSSDNVSEYPYSWLDASSSNIGSGFDHSMTPR